MAETEDDVSAERSSEDIRQDIKAKRERITETVDRLNARIQESLDWKGYVSRYPYASVGIAAGTGLLLSAMFKGRRTPSQRLLDSLAASAEHATRDLRHSMRKMIFKTAAPGVVGGTLFSVATKALANYVQTMSARPDGPVEYGDNTAGTQWTSAERGDPSPTPSNRS